MKDITLINDTETLNQQWTSSQFTDVYSGPYTGTAIAINGDNPEKGLITLRSHVENNYRLTEASQKFIIAIRFYSFGDMATIDVVSLSKRYHKNIFSGHMKNLNWSYGQSLPKDIDKNIHTPYICIGGHMSLDQNGKLQPYGASTDYGNDFCGSIAEDIAAYVLTACGLQVSMGNAEKGAECIQNLMDLMELHKQTPDFYERFIDQRTDLISKTDIHPQTLSALTHMQAWDFSLANNIDFMNAVAGELSDGLLRYVTVKQIQQKLVTLEELG